MKINKRNHKQEKKTLRVYKSPTLKKYGKIAALTSGGSPGGSDGQAGRQPK